MSSEFVIELFQKLKVSKLLSDKSANLYVKYLINLNNKEPFNNLMFLKNTDNILKKLENYSDNTKKTILSAITSILGLYNDKSVYKKLHKFYFELMMNKANDMKNIDSSIKTEKENKNWIEWEEIITIRERLKNEVSEFVNNKIIVFDDQELVAMLDYRSNRRYTLPSPKLGLLPIDGNISNSMLSTTGVTAWVTYMFENTSGNTLNSFPCNYFNKISGNGTPSQIMFKFSGNSFSNMATTLSGVKDGYVANKFYALVQTGTTPTSSAWKKIDITSQIPGYTSGYINPTSLTGVSFTISYSGYTGATAFDFEDHMSGVTSDYLWNTTGSTTQPQFGDEQPFPGSVRLVRSSDIEEMNFLINLPTGTFGDIPNSENGFSQNPTHPITGTTPTYITEVALLDGNKEPLVVAKTPTPVKRAGTQVFAIRLDF